jgi:DNA-binding NarL/FixJ family response regulator
LGSTGGTEPVDVSSSLLAGRDAELGMLRAALEGAEHDRPSLVLLTGDAGLGKTRLARELESIARERGAVALRGHCLELSLGELPYAPIAAALRDADQTVLAAALSKLAPEARRELARVFPDSVDETPAESASDDRFGQSRLFGWILGLLRNLSAESAVLLIVEDVHLADISSRDFLRFLAHSLRSERLLTVVTARSDELHREHPVRALVSELLRHDTVTRIELSPLPEDAVRNQVAGILGSAPSGDLVRWLFARAQGNPFYTEELLAAGGAETDELPASLQDALLLRADRLDEPARDVLRLIAAAGRPVDEALIEFAGGLPRPEVEAALRRCVDHNLLVCDRKSEHYSVRHALIAEALYNDLLPVERASLHRGIASALEQRASPDSAAERAHHLRLAHEPALALLASIEAGVAAERVFGYGEALAHFSRAIELWELQPPTPGTTSLDFVGLLARAAQAARWMGESDTAHDLCQRALGSFDHAEDPLRAAQLYERLGRYQPWDIEASLAAYDRGLSLLPEECAAQRMRFYVDEALALSFLGRWDDAREKAAAAIELGQGRDTAATESSARALLGTSIAFLGDPIAGEAHLRDALVLARQAGSTEDLVQIYLDLGEVLRLEGRIVDALGVMLEGEEVASGVGALPYRNFMAANAAEDLLRLGRWDELEARLMELAKRELDRPAELLTESVSGRFDAARGRFEEAAAHFQEAAELCQDLDLIEFVSGVYSGYAELELWRGRPEAARARIAEGFAKLGTGTNLLHIPMLHSIGARVEADLAELARARRDSAGVTKAADAAKAHHARLGELLEADGASTTPPEANAHLASCAAELTRALRAPDAGRWQTAGSLWREHNNMYNVAYATYRQAEALVVGRAQRSTAQAALDAAAALCEQLGAEPLLADLRALARRARLSPGAPKTAGDDPAVATAEANPYSLTERELEVLRLLGAGMTNREISQTLFISQHTAGVHVSHILGKLGVANRAMAAAVAERLGLVPRG